MPVSIEQAGDIWTIIHDRPEARNAMDRDSAHALHDAFPEFDASEASVAVLWGKGGYFCSGWDLKLAATLQDPVACKAYFNDHAFPEDLSAPPGPGVLGPSRLELSKPVIAALEGPAVAGGMELALWADMRVMAETAYRGVYCRRWGIHLDGWRDGASAASGGPREGTGDCVDRPHRVETEEGARIGLAERIVPHGTAQAEALACEIARFPQAAVRTERNAIIETRGMPVREALRYEWDHGLDAIERERAAGASRFRDGAGRSGDFVNI